ncbi:MAG: CPBP family intramembrane metalloprotease [Lachnospiraceae bacterium]|nr:CPBP family intramembrane metalloprotease [Lachnospiraceae bacterium]MBR6835201.1 CPBP family intramembrane metalloprotease [Oscillospiraceae bacterium]MBR6982203.1 CPBP family intramembrane metalloprotease [Ruminococcus sp.]
MELNPLNETKTELKKELRRDSAINAVLLFVFWALYFGIAAVLKPLTRNFIDPADKELFRNVETLLFYVLLYPIGFSLIFIINKLLYKGEREVKISECFRKPVTSPGWTAKWIFLTIGATYATAMLSSLIFIIVETFSGAELSEADMSSDNSALGIITILLSAPVFAPIFEELFFRGTLYRNVRNHGTWSMMIVCGLTFGIWHGNYPQFLFASAMGFFSCFLFEKTKSIIPSMIVHFVINSIGSFMTILVGSAGLSTTEITTADSYELMLEHPLFFLLLFFIGMGILTFLVIWLVFFIIEIAYHKESFVLEEKNPEISEGKKFWIYLSSPLMALVMLGMLAYTIFRALGGNI